MDLIIGLGEIGLPWFNLISKVRDVTGIDIDPKKSKGEWHGDSIEILNICIPFEDDFIDLVVDYTVKYKPKMLVIHSTIKPFTTMKIDQDKRLPDTLQVLYSPIRGVHKRMESDLLRYDKFYASYQDDYTSFEKLLSDLSIKGLRMKNPHTLEFAKILCDTTYFGFLIAYAMKTEEIATKFNIDYDEMWQFADQIHQHLRNRPPAGLKGFNKLYVDPNGIGGHCILPNMELLKDDLGEVYALIHQINEACIERHKT
jgi:UDP-N-acetyl-D-mannosaminuronate dehydrogenase